MKIRGYTTGDAETVIPAVPLDKPAARESTLMVYRNNGSAMSFSLREGDPRKMMKIGYTSAGDQGIMYVYQDEVSFMFPIMALAYWTIINGWEMGAV